MYMSEEQQVVDDGDADSELDEPHGILEQFRYAVNGMKSLPSAVFLLLWLFIGFMIILILFGPAGERGLEDVEYARGVITVLFAGGTIALGMAIAMAALFMEQSEQMKDRLEHAYKVFAGMIGILGIIIGFYFATNGSGGTP